MSFRSIAIESIPTQVPPPHKEIFLKIARLGEYIFKDSFSCWFQIWNQNFKNQARKLNFFGYEAPDKPHMIKLQADLTLKTPLAGR